MGKPKIKMGIRGTIDERGRIVIPKHLMEELGLGKGDMIVFERVGEHFVIRKLDAFKRRLEETMSWNPERTAEPEPVSPEEIKGIWKT
jgi:AbrB family looped-hinge helix DNA binding protein